MSRVLICWISFLSQFHRSKQRYQDLSFPQLKIRFNTCSLSILDWPLWFAKQLWVLYTYKGLPQHDRCWFVGALFPFCVCQCNCTTQSPFADWTAAADMGATSPWRENERQEKHFLLLLLLLLYISLLSSPLIWRNDTIRRARTTAS